MIAVRYSPAVTRSSRSAHWLAPSIRWRPPVLELGKYPTECDIHLNGRGLLLIPSYFCRNTPVSLADPDLPPVLLYPLHHSPAAIQQAVGHAPLATAGRSLGNAARHSRRQPSARAPRVVPVCRRPLNAPFGRPSGG
ncbi:hypothetical protein [Streptomyces sp. NPDC001536]|uniref:hypothetical protein n=1 Tax=Streptomyces sp. NPDC001536 TaxID=3364583 RepID=UPI003674986E